jgi:hypothetical protein
VKSLQVLHPSFGVYAGVLAAALVVIAGVAVASPGVKGHLPRLGKCAIAGAAAATALIAWASARRHAQLVAAAARPVNGHRLPVAFILADGWVFTALAVTVALFAVVTLALRRRRAPAFGQPVQRRPVRTGGPR